MWISQCHLIACFCARWDPNRGIATELLKSVGFPRFDGPKCGTPNRSNPSQWSAKPLSNPHSLLVGKNRMCIYNYIYISVYVYVYVYYIHIHIHILYTYIYTMGCIGTGHCSWGKKFHFQRQEHLISGTKRRWDNTTIPSAMDEHDHRQPCAQTLAL